MDAINTPTYMRLRDQVRADIVAGLWPLGSHVTLAQLASHYEVSANPVREALLQLQGEGVIAMRMNRGAVIPLVDKSYVDNLYKLRGAIQSMLAREAANLVTPAQIEQLLYLVKAYENAAQSSDTAVCVQANRKLHRFIDAIADNPLAVAMLDGRSSLVDAYRQTVGYGAGRLEVVLQQHRKIAGAVAAGNADLAAQAVIEHVDSSREDLIAILSSQEAKLK